MTETSSVTCSSTISLNDLDERSRVVGADAQ